MTNWVLLGWLSVAVAMSNQQERWSHSRPPSKKDYSNKTWDNAWDTDNDKDWGDWDPEVARDERNREEFDKRMAEAKKLQEVQRLQNLLATDDKNLKPEDLREKHEVLQEIEKRQQEENEETVTKTANDAACSPDFRT